jgi:hypothetical protein
MAKPTKKLVAAGALLGGLVGLGVSACAATASGNEQPVGLMNIQHPGPRKWPLTHSPLVRQADTLSSIASAIQRPQGRDRAGVRAQVLRLKADGLLAQMPSLISSSVTQFSVDVCTFVLPRICPVSRSGFGFGVARPLRHRLAPRQRQYRFTAAQGCPSYRYAISDTDIESARAATADGLT